MNFHQSFKKCSILTPDIRKQPQTLIRINLKGILTCNEIWPPRGSYVHNSDRIFGGIPKMLVLCNFLRKLMVSHKKIHRDF